MKPPPCPFAWRLSRCRRVPHPRVMQPLDFFGFVSHCLSPLHSPFIFQYDGDTIHFLLERQPLRVSCVSVWNRRRCKP